MGPFTRSQIIKSINEGEIAISPFPGDQKHPEKSADISTASIDLALSDELRIPLSQDELEEKIKQSQGNINSHLGIPLLSEQKIPKYLSLTKAARIKPGHAYILRPGERVIGITKERLTLKNNICAFIFARSSIARFFLKVEFAPFIEPGVDNQTVLEMKNDAPWPIALQTGARVCKVVFFRALSASNEQVKYSGRYTAQKLIQENEKIEEVGYKIGKVNEMDNDIIMVDKKFMKKLEEHWPVT